MRKTTSLLALCAAIVLPTTAACSGDDDSADPTTPTIESTTTTPAGDTTTTSPTTSLPPAPTTTAPPPPSSTTPSTLVTITDPNATVPPTTPEGEPDWNAILNGLLTVLWDLAVNPDPDRVGDLCVEPPSPCDDTLGAQARTMHADGWHVEGLQPDSARDAVLRLTQDDLPIDEAGFVIVEFDNVLGDASEATMVGADGEVLFQIDSSSDEESIPARWLLIRRGDRWLLHEILDLP